MVEGREVPFGAPGPIPDPAFFAAVIDPSASAPLEAVVTDGEELLTWADHFRGTDPNSPRWIGDCVHDPKTGRIYKFKRS